MTNDPNPTATSDDAPWEETMKRHHLRRRRRRAKAVLAFGAKAVRSHKEVGGRTGQVYKRQTKGSGSHYTTWASNRLPNISPVGKEINDV